MDRDQITTTERFHKAAVILLPILKAIPKEAVKRHNLLFKDIIIDTMEMQDELPGTSLQDILAIDLPYYLNYGMSKTKFEGF